jgi:transposase
MRGEERGQQSMLMVIDPEKRVPKDHPIRRIRQLAQAALEELSPLFDEMYSAVGRPSIPPERLLKASLLMALYTVRSERMLCERLDYDLMFRWFLGLEMDEPSFDHSTFSRNRARLVEHEVAGEFFRAVVEQARRLKLLSDEHFTVDGTLVEAWTSLKSFQRKDKKPSQPPDDPGNPTVNFHGERRSNQTHRSTTDAEALLARKGKGKEAKLYYSANALAENRNFLLVDFQVEPADGAPSAARPSRWPTSGCPARAASRWPQTRVTIPATSSRRVGDSRSLLTSRKIMRDPEVRPLMRAPPAIPAMRSVSDCASGSRRGSAG